MPAEDPPRIWIDPANLVRGDRAKIGFSFIEEPQLLGPVTLAVTVSPPGPPALVTAIVTHTDGDDYFYFDVPGNANNIIVHDLTHGTSPKTAIAGP